MSFTRPLRSVAEKMDKLRKELREGGESLIEGMRPLENVRPLRNVLRRRRRRD